MKRGPSYSSPPASFSDLVRLGNRFAPGCTIFGLFKFAVPITILMAMPVISKPLDCPPAFGEKAMIMFKPRSGRHMFAFGWLLAKADPDSNVGQMIGTAVPRDG